MLARSLVNLRLSLRPAGGIVDRNLAGKSAGTTVEILMLALRETASRARGSVVN
jgi:hypothetical protein